MGCSQTGGGLTAHSAETVVNANGTKGGPVMGTYRSKATMLVPIRTGLPLGAHKCAAVHKE